MHVSRKFTARRRAVLFALLAAGAAGSVQAQSPDAWPTRTVTIIVPFSAGGGTDIGTRVVAQRLSQIWGQPVVVDNKPGAGGNIGLDAVARAKPDGYTLLTGNVGTQSINPTLYKKLPYNPDTSFAPVSLMTELPFALVVPSSLPVNSAKELVAMAKSKPGKLNYASSGIGGSPHLSMETFKIATGTDIMHVPYKGGGAAMADLVAGNVQMLFASILETSSYVKAGKLRALAVTGNTRSPAMPDVPTLTEAGIIGADAGSWLGLLAPAHTPKSIVDKIAADVKKVVAMPDVSKLLIEQGAVPVGSTPEQFAQLIASDRKRYGKIINDNKISAD